MQLKNEISLRAAALLVPFTCGIQGGHSHSETDSAMAFQLHFQNQRVKMAQSLASCMFVSGLFNV